MKCWTEKDPLLSRLCRFVISVLPADDLGKEFQQFVSRQKELSVLNGCLLWVSRLIIPPEGRKYLMDQLHETHLGSSRMKSLCRGYIWWPGMDSEIEDYVKAFGNCQLSQPLFSLSTTTPLGLAETTVE